MSVLAAGENAYKLHHPFHEFVFIEWDDVDTGLKCTLGALSQTNRQKTAVEMRVACDNATNAATFYLSTTTRILTARHERRREVFIPIPLDYLQAGSLSMEKVSLCDIAEPSVARAVQEAGLSESGFVMRANFRLEKKSPCLDALMSVSTKRIRPCNRTASELLYSLKSLLRADLFTVYVKWSSYAEVGLREFKNRLPGLAQHSMNFVCLYSGRPAKHLDWSLVMWISRGPPEQNKQAEDFPPIMSPPPAYHVDVDPSFAVEVAKSPTAERCGDSVPATQSVSGESLIPETPISPLRSIPPTPCTPAAGLFSSSQAEGQPQTIDMAKLSVPIAPPDDLVVWLAILRSRGIAPHAHPRLQDHLLSLGSLVRRGEHKDAVRERARCTVLLCFDPRADATDGELEDGATMLQEMVGLVVWINGLRDYGDVDLFSHLCLLGRIARDVVAGRCGASEFQMGLARCEAHAIIELGDVKRSHKCVVCKKPSASVAGL